MGRGFIWREDYVATPNTTRAKSNSPSQIDQAIGKEQIQCEQAAAKGELVGGIFHYHLKGIHIREDLKTCRLCINKSRLRVSVITDEFSCFV